MPTALPIAEHFCTYFDHRYALHGLAMWRSLKAHHPSAVLHVLCLTEPCLELMAGLGLPDVCLYRLGDLERADPELLRARDGRTTIEYYFTLTPSTLLHLFQVRPDVRRLTYVDADLYFLGDPQAVIDEAEGQSIALVEHRFPESLRDLIQYGRFNVGWLTFRRDATALQCLADWRMQCLEWCHDRVEDGRYADQKYLDAWPERYPAIRVIAHPGANLAPWNLARWTISVEEETLTVDGRPAVFFHAHGFRPASPARARSLNLDAYGCEETPLLRTWLFDPYEEALTSAAGELGVPFALALLAEPPRHLEARLESALATVDALRHDLTLSEADRAARLELILKLQGEQQELNTACTTLQVRLDHVQGELATSEADRAARLELILKLQAERQELDTARTTLQVQLDHVQDKLATSEADRAARLELILKLQSEQQDLDAARATLQSQLDRARSELTTSESTRAELQSAVDALRARLLSVEQSRSWRWTTPLRQMAKLLQRAR